MNNSLNYRKSIIDSIIPFARQDERIVLLVGDMGFGAINRFKDEFPNRIYNMGIMEQGSIGIATGMAMSGLIPVYYSIVNFLVYRGLEQIRNDVVLQNQNVKFIATGVNDYFKFLGKSHCCGNDDVKILDMVGLKVYNPYEESADFETLVKEWILSPEAGYIRV